MSFCWALINIRAKDIPSKLIGRVIFIRFKVNTQQPNRTFQVWIKLDFFLPFILYYQILYGSKLSAETKQIQTHSVDMNEILEYSCIFMMLLSVIL